MSILMAIFLGIVQGVTEFLPVSSSGHLAIFQNLFNMENIEESHLFFDVLLHLGTLVSVCIVYRKEIMEMIHAVISMFTNRKRGGAEETSGSMGRLAIMIIVATLPLIVIIFLKDYIERLTSSTLFVGVALLITGAILYSSDKLAVGKKSEKNMTVIDAIIVGVSQAIACVPGLSRSGVTITTGIATGFSREFAVNFSFLLSIPAILGANLVSLVSAVSGGVDWSNLPAYLIGLIVAAVVGFFAIRLVKTIVDSRQFSKFSFYCWGVGLLSIILSLIL